VAGHHPAEQDLADRGEADHDAALVIRRGRPGHPSRLGQLLDLVGQSAAAVDEPVGDVGHPLAPVGGLPEDGQDLELDVAQAAVLAKLLVDGVLEQAASLDQGEVGGRPRGVQGCGVRHGHRPTCFEFKTDRMTIRFEFEA
jgi:hypothetical protein